MRTTILTILILTSLVLKAQKVICFKNDGVNGVIFTKEYFANNKQNFTPKTIDLIEIERQLKKLDGDLSSYYRQYIGRNVSKKEIVVQLIPQSRAKLYKNWNKKYLYVQDDIEIRYAYYDLKTKKIFIKPKDKFGG